MSRNLDEIIRLGSEAEYILNSDAFKLVFKELEEGWTGQWASGNAKTPEEREDVFRLVRALLEVRSKMIGLLDNKRVAKDQVERANKRAANAA